MKIVKVTYTVQENYIEQNKENIRHVMSDLRTTGNEGINYSSYVKEDGVTFVHLAHFASAEDNQKLSNLPSFQTFQQQLQESKLVSPPVAENLTLVGSTSPIFNH